MQRENKEKSEERREKGDKLEDKDGESSDLEAMSREFERQEQHEWHTIFHPFDLESSTLDNIMDIYVTVSS